MLEYQNPQERTGVWSRHDVVDFKAGEDIVEGTIVAKKTADGLIYHYDPAASDGTETPVGVAVYDDATAGSIVHVVMRGNIGSDFAKVKIHDTFSGDGTTTSFTLSREPKTVLSVKIDGADVTDYTISGNTITFSSAPASGASIEVDYFAAPNDDDFWKLAPALIIETVQEI